MKKPCLMVFAVLSLCLLAGCVTRAAKKDFSAFEAAAPRSILVVPVVNKSLDVDAPNYVLTTLPIPLAEKGYYVFPVNTSKFVLEQEGFYEGDRVHMMPPESLAKLFDADAILYVTIHRWDAKYVVFSTQVTVEFEYRIVGRDGAELWKDRQRMVYVPQNNSHSSLLGMLISAALARAAPNYMPLTRQANFQAFYGSGGIPVGPYKLKVEKK